MKTKDTKEKEDKDLYDCCIECREPVFETGFLPSGNDFNGDGWYISRCDNPKCSRYGLLTTVTKWKQHKS